MFTFGDGEEKKKKEREIWSEREPKRRKINVVWK